MTGEYPRMTDTFIQREIDALRRAGVEVHEFSIRRPSAREAGPRAIADATTYVLPVAPLRLLRAHLSLFASSPRRYAEAARLAWRTRTPGARSILYQAFYFAEAAVVAFELRQREVSHLHNHFGDSSCTVAMLAATLGGITFSFTIHGPGEFLTASSWALDEKASRALFVACISHFCRSQVMIWAPVAAWPRLHVVHCGVRICARALAPHRDDGAQLLWVGRLAKLKGLPTLIDAVSLLRKQWPALRLDVVGDGPDRAALARRVVELGLESQVRFLGYLGSDEVAARMRESDVFVMSSLAEGVPVVLMEAMAAGLPVVAPAIAGLAELVDHGTSGFLTPAGDAAALVERVSELLARPDLRRSMGAAGRARVEREFDVDREAAWLRHILERALAGDVVAVRAPVGETS